MPHRNQPRAIGVPRALPRRIIRCGTRRDDGHPGARPRQRLSPRRMLTTLSLAGREGTAMAVLTRGVARCSCRAPRNSGLTAPMRHPAGPGCSTARPGELDCPAITHQCVPSSTARHRPERRSDDGQMIFEALPAAREPGSDLGFCGAPLRNRTVDLLLTMDHRKVP